MASGPVRQSDSVAGPLSSDRVRITHAVTFDSTAGEADVIGVDAEGTSAFPPRRRPG